MIDINTVREDFPILKTKVYGKPLVYLDNGATTQKPQSVIDAIVNYYTHHNANVHRGVHYLSQLATDKMEMARDIISKFINVEHTSEIIFNKGTTDGINALAFSLGEDYIQEGDCVLISEMEHHSNIVPWQMMCERKKATLKFIPIDEDGNLQLADLDVLFENVKICALTWVSNTLGTINPIKEIIKKASEKKIITVIDAAQAIPHMSIDVQDLDCDFLVASAHKMYGPTGIGIMYGKLDYLNKLTPYQGGGSMITEVKMQESNYGVAPFRHEAGTPNIAGAIGMAAAVSYINAIGIENIASYEHSLLQYFNDRIEEIPQVKIWGSAKEKAAVLSMTFEGMHPYDIGELLDKQGVAIRTGHHCCQPIMDRYKITGTLRASIGLYNNQEDIDRFIIALQKAISMLQ